MLTPSTSLPKFTTLHSVTYSLLLSYDEINNDFSNIWSLIYPKSLFKGAGSNFQTGMATTLEVDPSLLEKPAKADQLHFLPCNVAEDAPNLPVDSRFTAFTVDQGAGQLTNQLRGRPMDGAVTSLPDGYTGLVAEGRQGLIANQEKILRCLHQRQLAGSTRVVIQ